MAQHKFEGESEDITKGQLEFIKHVIEKEGFKDRKVTIEAVGGAADNYGANVKRIVIEGENGNFSMIAKIAPSFELIRQSTGVDLAFKNEHLMYTEILPKMLQLQKQAKVSEEDQLKFPKCYGTNLEEPNEVILIEDLKTSGFALIDRFISFSDEHVTNVLRNLAIFHSLSYVLKSKEPETYNYYKDNMRDIMGAMAEGTLEKSAVFQQVETLSLNLLDDPEHQNIMRNKVSNVIDLAIKMTEFEKGSQYAVIQHGDCWTNNIMFKFEGETLKQSMFIDYQLSKNFSPVYDLFYLIFNCTDHETRIKNFYDWIDYYHSELDKSLSNYGLKANNVYPRDQLDADLKRYSKLAFGCTVFVSGILTIKPEEADKFKEAMGSGQLEDLVGAMGEMHVDTAYRLKKRLVGLIESFTTFGLL